MQTAVWGRLRSHVVGILAATACWMGVVFLLTATPIHHAILDWENRTLDYRFQVRGPIPQDPRIVLIDIDDRSLDAIGRWPWVRTHHARMIDLLSQSEAAVIGYDILFEHRGGQTEDRALVEAITRAGNVYLPTGFELAHVDGAPFPSAVREVGPYTEIRTAAAGVAHISSNRDPDGTIRRVPVVVDAEGRLIPALSLALAAGFFRAPVDTLEVEAGRAVILPVGDAPAQGRDRAARIPIDEAGMMIVNFAGKWDETFEHISFVDVLDAGRTAEGQAALAEIVRGKICLVSNTASGFDLKPTPFERAYPGGGIHANALNTIMTGQYVSAVSGEIAIAITAGLSVMSAVIVIASPWWLALAAVGSLIAGFFLVAGLAFEHGTIVPAVLPILASVSACGVALIAQNRSVRSQVTRLTAVQGRLAASLREATQALHVSETHLVDARNDLSNARAEMDGLRLQTREQDERASALEGALERAASEHEALQHRKRTLEAKLKDLLIQPVFIRATAPSTGTLHREWARYGVITRNSGMAELFTKVQRAAMTRHPVLILGKTGTGKDLVAHAVHQMSDRLLGPFVTVNLPAIQENLIESELFGHVKGAFTGAVGDKRGKFQTAEGGTILLDEIGDLRSELQAKLLRVVQTGEVDRVGGLRPDRVDVRIVAATNRDVHAMVDRGAFRSDLFYRLNVMTVVLPPLRERPDDLDILAEYFLDRYALDSGKPMKGITVKAMASLKAHPWRGNIRELEHTIARAVVLAAGDRVTEADLELTTFDAVPQSAEDDLDPFSADDKGLSDGEFIALLRRNHFEIGRTSEQLGVSRGTVGLRLKGICLGLLADTAGDREKAAAVLTGGEGSADVVRRRIDEYYSNLVDVLHQFETAEQALDGCRLRWKNLPQKYFKGLDILIHRYFEQPAAKP